MTYNAMTPNAPPVVEPVRDEFDEFYSTCVDGLTLQLHAYLGDLAEAQDVVQEAFCRALSRWKQISRYDNPGAWVRRVAWNLATSRFRRQVTALNFLRRQREEYTAEPTPDRVALTRALAQIPAQQRKALVLYHIAELTVGEIAEQEGVAEGTVKSRLSRGRTALAALLRKEN